MTRKEDALVPVPQVLFTLMVPEAAPAGTVAVICVAELITKEALVELKRTVVAALKFVPVITTDVPALPFDGLKLDTVGALLTTIVKVFEVAGLPVAHVALLVMTQVIVLPFVKVASAYDVLLVPTLEPFFFH